MTSFAGYLGMWKQAETQEKIAERRIRATVISANRLRWIHIVRNTVSELASTVAWASTSQEPVAPEHMKRALFLSAKLELLLNPAEVPSQTLMSRLKSYRVELGGWQPGVPVPKVADVLEAAQAVLKAEWVRVKKGE